MHSRVFLALCIASIAQLAVPQAIDPKSVDPALRCKQSALVALGVLH